MEAAAVRPGPGKAPLKAGPHPALPVPQVLVIDGRGHLLGRLAAIVAKQVLLGECGAPSPGSPGFYRECLGISEPPRAVMSPLGCRVWRQ